MEQTNFYKDIGNLIIHTAEHDFVLTQDITFEYQLGPVRRARS